MRPLDLPEKPQWILSFDFDGTLHDPGGRPPVVGAFFEKITELRTERSALWGINTGRSMEHVIEGLIESRFPFAPDWVVAREREIWFPNDYGRWIGDDKWNKECEKAHRKFFRKVRKVLAAIRAEVEEHTGATWVEQAGDPAGLIARTEEEMEWILGRVTELAAPEPLLGWQRNSIYLRFGHKNYQKGSSLRRVAEGFGLGPAQSFAIGDSHNDFEMLSPESAAFIACPGNAVDEVREHVEEVGGHVCAAGHSDGCVEALRRFFD
ncbi:sucrose phosphate synthase [Haloferula helveola]|uniref:Sucrose phosphate synthase n=1 Tax=Haloferula helveola TaxID=490095 RepID=A0ABM7RDH4_9BACT|nr:sucrose phosphate synthase [Haloferula helveola]